MHEKLCNSSVVCNNITITSAHFFHFCYKKNEGFKYPTPVEFRSASVL